MSDVELDQLTKVYQSSDESVTAVDDLDLTVEDGEFLVLVGPSGCGKSTTLRCIAGLEEVTEGAIRFGDTEVTDDRPKDRDIAMVFQNYALYPHMTARQNMEFGLKMSTDLSKEERADRVDDAASTMGIEELLPDKPKALSGGQQQRVALGRAIVRDPAVFLMDEPLSNLDAKLRAQMRTELQELQQDLGVTTVYVTHDQTEAMTMGDRIAILNHGELQQVGTPLECYHQPANQFVAGFLGEPTMNFLEVGLSDDALVHDEFVLPISSALADSMGSSELVLGIRPEDVILSTADDAGDGAIPATVTVVEPMGDASNVYVDVGTSSVTVSVEGHAAVNPGDEVTLAVDESRLHLFDRATGESYKHSDVEAAALDDADGAVEAP
ncbi:ABC transporter ATP-binding protein [Salinarchaeum laminariae]|uniref:ABC transporter ATP-binding protein n=1 Tax=Salinarchaeum laminariae TaxID=869888 RepID=UPI0020C181C0|nr:ABC transporter ATP-binding protein [Salinarchaeum laminariae]